MELSLPEDVFLKIASHLQESDVCALGICSRFCRESCSCDSLWERFARRRWPSWRISFRGSSPLAGPSGEGWRHLYIKRHNEVADKARSMVRSVEESLYTSQSVKIGLYKKIMAELKSLELSFVDVKMLLLKPKYSAALHLVSLHYCFTFLKVPVEDMVQAVVDNQISEGQVCVRWSTRGRLLFGFHMRDESHSLVVSLHEVASSQGHRVLQLLTPGAVREVMRIHIIPLEPYPLLVISDS
ncbi:hypothetical protein MLD38_038866 [Melastoma candidum]|uniref:Uncharacterized protein n=1 Tax=Melastoma candidum TaxID=119954 RepID=A0ACB9L2K7_9MYRT|nr:hypothetical protein MLD38_038866 [Melastoma candidum]